VPALIGTAGQRAMLDLLINNVGAVEIPINYLTAYALPAPWTQPAPCRDRRLARHRAPPVKGFQPSPADADEPDEAGENGLTPFGVLARTFDDRVTAGDLPTDRRPGAAFAAWPAVHGLAMLVAKGPLHDLDQAATDTIQRHQLDVVNRGL
jgi:Tetracyclin repressor-like, C-terminal domain